MTDLSAIWDTFDPTLPLAASEDDLYVDFAPVRGYFQVVDTLVTNIEIVRSDVSNHLLTGHAKCGKTTELNRAEQRLRDAGYATVFFDVAELETPEFEYTTLLLLMAGQIVKQLEPYSIKLDGERAQRLVEFLIAKEITLGGQLALDTSVKAEAEFAPLLMRLLGKFGIGGEIRGGFERSRAVTRKIEVDRQGFLINLYDFVQDAQEKVKQAGYKGLVVLCDGCDKLQTTATDEHGKTYDLQHAMFVNHASDLCDVPCHVIYTVPISIQTHLWRTPEVVPAIPVNRLPHVNESFPEHGRRLLTQVVALRLKRHHLTVERFFADPALLDRLIGVSGGLISDLMALIADAILNAQMRRQDRLEAANIDHAILRLSLQYTNLVEEKLLPTLSKIDQLNIRPASSNEYREIMFKRLALEYICDQKICVDLHPLVAASDAFQSWSRQTP